MRKRRRTTNHANPVAESRPQAPGDGPIIFVVDDDNSVREGLAGFVRSIGLRVETFATASEFLRRAAPEGPACLVLDLALPGLSGMDLQRELAATDRHLPIIFITGHGDIPTTVRAMKAGAVEFLTKPFIEGDLMQSIEQALERDREALSHRMELEDLRSRYETLTSREREVMKLVVQGMMNKQVAATLGAHQTTIKTHRGRVMRKMQAESFADLVRIAQRLERQE
jgi:FixJ family two-component response regulator